MRLRTVSRLVWVALVATATGCGSGAPEEPASVAPGASGAPSQVMSGTTATSGDGSAAVPLHACAPAALPLVMATALPAKNDTLDDALDAVDWSRAAFGANAATGLRAPSALRPQVLVSALTKPLAFVPGARGLERALDDAAASPAPVARSLAVATAALGGTATPEICVTLAESDLLATLRSRGLVPSGADARVASAVATIPPALASALAPLVVALADAKAEVDASLPSDPAKRASLENTVDFALWSAPRTPGDADVAIAAGVDVARVGRAAVKLALAFESAGLARFRGAATPSVDVPTTLGTVVVRGPGDDVDPGTTDSDAAALWIDTGGNDVIQSGAGAATKRRAVSVHVDLGGDDRYGYVTTDAGTKTRLPSDVKGRLPAGPTASRIPRQGAGYFGIGLLFDLGAGRDTYRSLAASQGTGAFGVGALYDDGGDDDYAAETLAQGASVRGIGLLLDAAGSDQRRLFTRGQGYASFGGVGVLSDVAGDDAYRADPGEPKLGGDPLYLADLFRLPNAKVKGNHNAAQGFAEGRRDLAGSITMESGGLAILRDREGRDRYVAGAFAQGGALEEGAGLLLDGGGNDVYEGLAYVQGAGIHRGLGLLLDASGDDAYDPTFPIVQTSLGVGHDYGAGLLMDLAGSDTFHGPTLSLGAGSAQGVGLLVAVGGSDAFVVANKTSLGTSANTQTPGRSDVTAGVFARAGGPSAYRVGDKSASLADSTWHDERGAAKSVGIDQASGTVGL